MNYFLGLELTGSNLKITAFTKDNKKFKLIKLDSFNLLDEGEKAEEQLIEWKKKNLFASQEIKAILSLSESSIYLKELELPKVKEDKLSEVIYWELSSLTPIIPNEAIYDWKVVSTSTDSQKTLVMIIKSGYIENLLSIFRKAGIEILAVEPTSVSFARSANADFKRCTLLSVVRENETDYVVLKGGVPVFSTSTSVTLRGVKGAKRKLGKKVTIDLAADAKKILDYWEARENQKIEQVIITGDVAFKYFGLALAINKFAKIPVGVGRNKTFKNIVLDGSPQSTLARYLVSFGAAARFTQKNIYEGVNLFPKKERELLEKKLIQERLLKKLSVFTIINFGTLAIFLIIFLFLKFGEIQINKKTNQARQFVSNHPANEYLQAVSASNGLFQVVNQLGNNQKDEGKMLVLISSLTPENLQYTRVSLLSLEKEEWKIEGKGDRNDILAFYEKLLSESDSKDISMPYSNFAKEKDNDFSVTIKW